MKTIQIIAILFAFSITCQAQSASTKLNPLEISEDFPVENKKQINTISASSQTAVLRIRQLLTQKMEYTQVARENGIEGTVMVEVTIANGGKIQEATILQSPHDLLDQAVTRSMKLIEGTQIIKKYPARTLKVKVPVNFRLK